MKYGGEKDVEAINYAICCGVKGIFTAHGKEIGDLELNPCIKKIVEQNLFDRIIFLDEKKKGKVSNVYEKQIAENGQALLVKMEIK